MSKKTVETQVRWAPDGWWPQVLSSDGVTWYNITKSPLGALVCTCTAAMYRGTCRHLDAAAELLETVQANDARGLELRDDTYHDKNRVAYRAAHGLVSALPPEPEPEPDPEFEPEPPDWWSVPEPPQELLECWANEPEPPPPPRI